MPDVDRMLHVLPEPENERIFREEIVPETLVGTPQDRPVVVFVAGQTGAGKTAVTKLVDNALPGAVNLNLDTYKPYHSKYDELLVADETTVGAYTSIDGHKWMEKAEAYAIESRFNVLMESAMRDPRDFEEPAARFKAAGYRVEVAVLAVHESDSRLGALDRYVRQVNSLGRGRLIDEQIHDACYRGVLRSTDAIDTDRLADSVFVLRRDAHVVYRNHLDPEGQWVRQPDTAQAVATERDRPRTAEETHRFAYSVRDTQARIAALPEDAQAAPAAELETALTLAQPLLHPGVDVERITGRAVAVERDARALVPRGATASDNVSTTPENVSTVQQTLDALEEAQRAVDRQVQEDRERTEAYHRQRERERGQDGPDLDR
jgi:UDP-N-acetylglucosamine kinase